MADAADKLLAAFTAGTDLEMLPQGSIGLIRAVALSPAQILKFRGKASKDASLDKPQLKLMLKIVAAGFDSESLASDNRAEIFDRYIAPASTAAFVGGFIATFTNPVWGGAPLVAGLGAFALAFAGSNRFWVKRNAISDKTCSRMIDLMADI